MKNDDQPQGTEEQTVDAEALDKSLQDLLKAADTTDLSKAYGGTSVETTGHVDERGKTPGGMAGSGDIGGIDDMMIGKLSDAGVPSEVIAAFSAFMKKEKDDEDEGEDDDKDDKKPPFLAEKSDAAPAEGETLKKTMDALRDDPAIADTVDVSPFLESLTARMSDQMDNLRKSQMDFAADQAAVNRAMARAMHQIGTLIKGQSGVTQELGKRLGIVERTPMPTKGAKSLEEAKALAKSMPGEAGNPETDLTKSEVCRVLTYMNLEKGIRTINGQSTGELAGLLEGGGDQSTTQPFVVEAVQEFLRENPKEAQRARTYR
jgi:hypothetical protein